MKSAFYTACIECINRHQMLHITYICRTAGMSRGLSYRYFRCCKFCSSLQLRQSLFCKCRKVSRQCSNLYFCSHRHCTCLKRTICFLCRIRKCFNCFRSYQCLDHNFIRNNINQISTFRNDRMNTDAVFVTKSLTVEP